MGWNGMRWMKLLLLINKTNGWMDGWMDERKRERKRDVALPCFL